MQRYKSLYFYHIKNFNMKKLFFPLFLIAMAALPAFVSAQTADEIIGKYIDAIGGRDNLKKINTLRMEGDIEVQGLKIPFTAQGINGKGFRTDAEFNGNKIIDIITPTMGWSQNPMANKATLQPITEEELKQRLDQLGPKIGLSAAHIVQKGLKDMCIAHEGLKPEGSGAPLYGVHRAEHRIDQFGVGGASVNAQQPRLQIPQKFVTLLEECDLDFLELVHGLKPPPCGSRPPAFPDGRV